METQACGMCGIECAPTKPPYTKALCIPYAELVNAWDKRLPISPNERDIGRFEYGSCVNGYFERWIKEYQQVCCPQCLRIH